MNCGKIPENLIDSELFGHDKGAFSGALRTKHGRFERAYGGVFQYINTELSDLVASLF